MTKRYPKVVQGDDGWSDWLHIRPVYRMRCCDCDLVHNIEIKAHKKSRSKAAPGYVTFGKEVRGLAFALRASRNNRATAQCRRARKMRI
jgi:hypothetical protein